MPKNSTEIVYSTTMPNHGSLLAIRSPRTYRSKLIQISLAKPSKIQAQVAETFPRYDEKLGEDSFINNEAEQEPILRIFIIANGGSNYDCDFDLLSLKDGTSKSLMSATRLVKELQSR